jgi:transcriptional regulator with XRE-family HTH domain
MPKKETLAEYVARIIREKGLKHNEVKKLSGGKITDGYVRGIMTGKADNLSVAKLKALARGIGVPEDDIFKVARGLHLDGDDKHQEQQPRYSTIVNLMSGSLKNRVLAELLTEVARLPLESQEEVLRTLRYINSRTQRASRSRKKG